MALSIRRRRPAPITPTPSRDGLRASAQRFVLKGRSLGQKQGAPKRPWQDEAWDYFDDVPVLKYSVWYQGNVMAKLRIFPAIRNADDPDAPLIPVSDPESGVPPDLAVKATAELERLKGELGGQSEIIRALNMNLEIAGEGYIIGLGPREIEVKDDVGTVVRVDVTDESWGVYSISQVTEKGDRYTITKIAGEKKGIDLDENLDTIIRVWQRHPRWSLEADCAMRGIVSDCEALTLLQNSIKAEAKSRMSGGYLLLPSTLRKGPSRPEPDEGEEAVVDEFTQLLYDGATEAVEDPSAASAVAPTFIFGDKEDLAQVRHLSIARAADATVLDKIRASIENIARGLNLPVEVVMGHQQTTFANAMQVKQDTFEDHFEPRCELICDVLAIAFLQPNLIDMGVAPDLAEQIIIGYDASKLITQVNPVDSADRGIELGMLSGEAWRRAKGWNEDDAPETGEEQSADAEAQRLETVYNTAAVLIRAGWEPEAILAALDLPPMDHTGAPPITIQAPEKDSGPSEPSPPVDEPAPVPEPVAASRSMILAAARSDGMLLPIAAARSNRNLGFDLMLLDRELRARLLVAANAALNRALELAGNRLRSKAGKIRSLAKAGKINPIYVGATLGPSLVAAAGIADDDLISDAAWAALGSNFDQWVAAAQDRALTLTSRVVPVSDTQREIVEQRQAADRAQAWEWMRDQLHQLAHQRLYAPDPAVPDVGEFDPTSRVPAGLVRQALARAGGATGLTEVSKVKPALRAADRSGDVWVAVNNNEPAGGIGLGETIKTVIGESGGGIEGYEWVYGPAYRLHPFEPHELLDTEKFENFDDDVLVAGDWIGDFYFPGDHDGCNCDIAPTIIGPGEVGSDGSGEPEAEDVEHLPTPQYVQDTLGAGTLGADRLTDVASLLSERGAGLTIGDLDALMNRGLTGGQRFELVDIRPTTFARAPRSLAMRGDFVAADGTRLAQVDRVFNFETKTLHAELFQVKKEAQGLGLAKQHLSALAELAQKFGIETFKVHASSDVGGYAWLKYGYLPEATVRGVRTLISTSINRLESAAGRGLISKAERDRGIRLLESVYDSGARYKGVGDTKVLWQIADDPVLGKPAFLGADWQGTLDLTDSASMNRFREYLGR